MRSWLLLLFSTILGLAASPAFGAVHEHRIPLDHGKLRIHDLNAALCQDLDLPACPAGGEIDLASPLGADFLLAVNACLWHGCSVELAPGGAAMLHVDPAPVPGKCEALRRLTRVWVAEQAPQATAAHARHWGLQLPAARIDPARPLVILIHGLDADVSDCLPMGELLGQSGRQVAYFSYPGDQPIVDSAALLARCLGELRSRFPTLRLDLIGHSMGGLVAREYVEGPAYRGGVERLILIATPNAGSSWARLRILLSLEENYHLRRDDPNWHWSWLITEGLGEAGADLLPGSEFLNALNARPRRAGVRYTIVAGNHSGVSRVEANVIDAIAGWMPIRARGWWGFGHCYRGLGYAADHFRTTTDTSDGPVAVESAKLSGVTDFVLLPADHMSLYLPLDGRAPAAWPVIQARLNS